MKSSQLNVLFPDCLSISKRNYKKFKIPHDAPFGFIAPPYLQYSSNILSYKKTYYNVSGCTVRTVQFKLFTKTRTPVEHF